MKKHILILSLIPLLGLVFFFLTLPDVSLLKSKYPQIAYDSSQKKSKIQWLSHAPPQWTSYSHLSKNLISAVVVSEDWNFFSHSGFDWDEMKASAKEVLQQKKFARGGSTITMQVAKNIFLTPRKTLLRKIREVILAIRLEKMYTKSQILEFYFNIIELGEGLYGIQKASAFYFNQTPETLSPKEAAFIAMLLPSPKKYSQSFRKKKLTPYATKIIESILEKMVKAKYLSPEEKGIALQTPLSFEKQIEGPTEEPEILDPQSLFETE